MCKFFLPAIAALSMASPSLANDFQLAKNCAAQAVEDEDASHSMVSYEKGIMLGADTSGKDDAAIYSIAHQYANGQWHSVTVSNNGLVEFQSYHQETRRGLFNTAGANIAGTLKSGKYETIRADSEGSDTSFSRQAMESARQLEVRYTECIKSALAL